MRISQGLAGFLVSAAFAASPVWAWAGDRNQNPVSVAGGAVVSADLLRHPINGKIRKMLLQAFEKMDAGDHNAAIDRLQETLAKHPDAAPYVHNLLGVEYVKIDQFQAAVRSFEQAVSLLPRDATTHYNFGLSLVCIGDYRRAGQEVRRALQLDPNNVRMQRVLEQLQEKDLLQRQQRGSPSPLN